jgi:hypothetical protein
MELRSPSHEHTGSHNGPRKLDSLKRYAKNVHVMLRLAEQLETT